MAWPFDSRYFYFLCLALLCLPGMFAADRITNSTFYFKDFRKDSSDFESHLALYGHAKVGNGAASIEIPSSGRVVCRTPVKLFDGSPRRMLSFSTSFSFSIPSGHGVGLALFMVPIGFPVDVFEFDDVGSFGLLSSEMNRTVLVQFDTLMNDKRGDLNSNHVRININGSASIKSANLSSLDLKLNDGKKLQAWIDYQAGSKRDPTNQPGSMHLEQSSPTTTAPPQQQQFSGPRCAPTYSVVDVILEKKDDGPGPRCGHTLTAVAAVGEEGTPGYIAPRLILFGGATALEGNSIAPGTPSSAGSAGIRLAGATADVHCYDVQSKRWTRITPFGEPPTPRAAHVATAVGTMVVIQGGIGPAGLSAEDLHVLDLTQQKPRWHRVVVQGPGPGPRYGHAMALVGQRYLMSIGGNDGKRPLADVWALDTAAKLAQPHREGIGAEGVTLIPGSADELHCVVDRREALLEGMGMMYNYSDFNVQHMLDALRACFVTARPFEWYSSRSLSIPEGWSARAGQGMNPYMHSAKTCGSSSGSAIAVAANMVAVSLGTETDGSIICPADYNSVVGLKPTVGLTSRAGVVPISPRMDTGQ